MTNSHIIPPAGTPEQRERRLASGRRRTARSRAKIKKALLKRGYNSTEKLTGDLFRAGRITKKLYTLIMTLEVY